MKSKSDTLQAQGFTLIEMLVTITIIIILAGLSMGGYNYVIQKQAMSQAATQIALLSKALEEYKLDNGNYPAPVLPATEITTNDLYKLLYSPPGKIYLSEFDPKSNKQGWLDLTVPATPKVIDPWGAEYIYRNGSHTDAKNPDFDLISKGKDGLTNASNPAAPENKDDIRN